MATHQRWKIRYEHGGGIIRDLGSTHVSFSEHGDLSSDGTIWTEINNVVSAQVNDQGMIELVIAAESVTIERPSD